MWVEIRSLLLVPCVLYVCRLRSTVSELIVRCFYSCAVRSLIQIIKSLTVNDTTGTYRRPAVPRLSAAAIKPVSGLDNVMLASTAPAPPCIRNDHVRPFRHCSLQPSSSLLIYKPRFFLFRSSHIGVANFLEGLRTEAVRLKRPRRRGEGYGEGCLLLSRQGSLGERRKLPSRVLSGAPAENRFWFIWSLKEHMRWHGDKFDIFDIFVTRI